MGLFSPLARTTDAFRDRGKVVSWGLLQYPDSYPRYSVDPKSAGVPPALLLAARKQPSCTFSLEDPRLLPLDQKPI